MGDFDRNKASKAPGGQGKQIAVMGLLGVVLIGVLGYHFMSRGPQPAAASVGGMAGGVGMGIPLPVETPEQASNALREDPTAALLRPGTRTDDASLDAVPRNPFLMAESWRASLVQQQAAEPVAVVAPLRPKAIPVLKRDDFKLGSTIRQGGGYQAILNGQVVSVGAVVGEARVLDIQEGRVVLQHAANGEGPTIQVTMEPKLK